MAGVVTIRIGDGPNRAAREWAARLIATRCGYPYRIAHEGEAPAGDGALVSYLAAPGARGLTIADSGFFDGKTAGAAPFLKTCGRLQDVPIFHGTGTITRNAGAAFIDSDIFAAAFSMAGALDEKSSSSEDRHGRFPAAESLLGSNDLLGRPLIDEYAHVIRKELAQLYPGLEYVAPWGKRHDFAVAFTHDIETLARPSRLGYLKTKLISAGRLSQKGETRQALRTAGAGIRRAAGGENPNYSFELLRQRARPWPSTFFLFGGVTSELDGAYNVLDTRLRSDLEKLMNEGCEIGVHLGYETRENADLMRVQASRVETVAGKRAVGARHHYLRARFPDAWKAHEEAGLAYDASFAFAESAGFRAATSYPFRPFDVDTGREMRIFEAPLVAMDGTFFQYGELPPEKTVEAVLSLAEKTRLAGGVFTLLWHNTMVDEVDKGDQARSYAEIAETLKTMPAWGATVGACVERWKAYCDSLEVSGE